LLKDLQDINTLFSPATTTENTTTSSSTTSNSVPIAEEEKPDFETLSIPENAITASGIVSNNPSPTAVDEARQNQQMIAQAKATSDDEEDRSPMVPFETEINLARLNKKIGKRIHIIDNLLERLSLRVNPKVYFFFGHTGVGMWIRFFFSRFFVLSFMYLINR
jgi:hypothetical protein